MFFLSIFQSIFYRAPSELHLTVNEPSPDGLRNLDKTLEIFHKSMFYRKTFHPDTA